MIKPSEIRNAMPCNQRDQDTDRKSMAAWMEESIRDAASHDYYSTALVLQEYPGFDNKNRPYWFSVFINALQEFQDNGFMICSSFLSTLEQTTYVIGWEP